jgi:protein TonB
MGMRDESRYPERILKMRLFFSISFLIHLAFFSMASAFLLNSGTDSLPTLPVEVTLYPQLTEEKEATYFIKKENKDKSPLPSPEIEATEKTASEAPSLPLPEIEVKEHPQREAPPFPIKDTKEEIRDKEEQIEKKSILLASLNPETVLTVHRESPPDPLPPPSRPSSEEEETKQMATHPSLSDGEVIFIHPKYAENPKPLYPREARRKGFQGEVVLKVEVLPSGLVGQVEVKKSSGHEILDRSALSAVKQWKFFPAKKGEIAVTSWVNIPVKFQLQ